MSQPRSTPTITPPLDPDENGLQAAVSLTHGNSFSTSVRVHDLLIFTVRSNAQRHTAASKMFNQPFETNLQASSQTGFAQFPSRLRLIARSRPWITHQVHLRQRHCPLPSLLSITRRHCWPYLLFASLAGRPRLYSMETLFRSSTRTLRSARGVHSHPR